MILPTLKYENKLAKQGFRLIAGLDEAGRGAWAGPIAAAAVIWNHEPRIMNHGIRDSKLLTPKQREELFAIITKKALAWGIGMVSHEIIDEIGIGKANQLAMLKAIENLKLLPDYLLIDGRIKLNLQFSMRSIINADEKIFSCACASIIAKVWRDRWMQTQAHKKYSQYGFDRHKGYGTRQHYENILKYGVCPLHRKSFRPIKNL